MLLNNQIYIISRLLERVFQKFVRVFSLDQGFLQAFGEQLSFSLFDGEI